MLQLKCDAKCLLGDRIADSWMGNGGSEVGLHKHVKTVFHGHFV